MVRSYCTSTKPPPPPSLAGPTLVVARHNTPSKAVPPLFCPLFAFFSVWLRCGASCPQAGTAAGTASTGQAPGTGTTGTGPGTNGQRANRGQSCLFLARRQLSDATACRSACQPGGRVCPVRRRQLPPAAPAARQAAWLSITTTNGNKSHTLSDESHSHPHPHLTHSAPSSTPPQERDTHSPHTHAPVASDFVRSVRTQYSHCCSRRSVHSNTYLV